MYLTFSRQVTREAGKAWAVCFPIALGVHRVEKWVSRTNWMPESGGKVSGTGVAASPKGVPSISDSWYCHRDPFPPGCLLLGLRPSIPVGLKPPWAHSNMGFSWSSNESPGPLGKVLPARTLAFW